MASLFRNSRIILTRSLYITRTAATTGSSSGGARAATNLSEASRSADGTDMAMRDAEQRGTSANKTSQSAPKTKTSWIPFAMGVVLAVGGYYSYFIFADSSNQPKSIHKNNEGSKKSS